MAHFIKAARMDQIKPGKGLEVEVGGEIIALFNVDGKIFATSGVCPHAGGPLGEGELIGNAITCPLHAWQFEVESGRCMRIPAMKLRTYKTKVEGSDVLVSVE